MKTMTGVSAVLVAATTVLVAAGAAAQTRSARDTATAYGARLNAKGQPADVNQQRVNSRINSRIENRLALRIERYRPDSTDNPVAAFRTRQDDQSRQAPVIAPPVIAPAPRQDDAGEDAGGG